MNLKLRTVPRADVEGAVDFVIEGDPNCFFWLISAAGNARDGFKANQAEATDGSGNRLILLPERALPDQQQKWGSKSAHLQPPGQSAPLPPEIEKLPTVELMLSESEINALTTPQRIDLEKRGIKVVQRATSNAEPAEQPAEGS